jgi:hypothetical protein
MILVPRQLQRAGMTGTVPYYGGRLTPAQAYAVSHPQRSAPRAPAPPAPPSPPRTGPTTTLDALEHLRATGVISGEEYTQLRARVAD